MKKHPILLIASVLAVILSLIIILRVFSAKSNFELSVKESLKTTEGYDQMFIDRVNRLEDLLAKRAQFGYSGGKDPMTGNVRQVVQPKPVAAPVRAVRQQQQPRDGNQVQTPVAAPQNVDDVKLTAVIADATGKKITAVIMVGERSYSVDAGDKIAGRKILRITNEGIYMETDSLLSFYDIYGNVVKRNKESGIISSLLKEDEEQLPEQQKKPPQKTPKK
jgi:hypothetical protein